MKKYFVAYRFTGELPEILEQRMRLTVDALGKAGIDAYCNLFDQHEYEAQALTPRQIMDKAFERIDDSDGLFVLLASSDKSEGQLMEVGYALARGKHIIVASQVDVQSYVPDMANLALTWEDTTDLQRKLEGIQL